jgi:hypothetical protein
VPGRQGRALVARIPTGAAMSGAAPGAAIDVERRAALNGAKLAALVAGRWGAGDDRRRGAVGATATLLDPEPVAGAVAGASGVRSGWVLPDGDAARALGPALVWAGRHGVGDLHLVADPGPGQAGALARQAGLFTDGPAVWAVHGTALTRADAAPVPVPAPAPAPPDLVDLLIDAGLEIVVEGGMVRGEINGLEVARIVHGHTTAGEPIDEPLLEVGVGKADRELTAMVHSGLPAVDQLGRVAEIVRGHRRPDAPRHPLNQLVPERWLRAVLCRSPGLVGLRTLRPAEGARARPNLTERDVAIATGETADGAPAVVACAVGIALDLVPAAADARAVVDAARPAGEPPSTLLLAVPRRDDHPAVRDLAARLAVPAEVAPVPDDWRSAG